MYKKGLGTMNKKKDAGNRTLCPYRNFSQAINFITRHLHTVIMLRIFSCPVLLLVASVEENTVNQKQNFANL